MPKPHKGWLCSRVPVIIQNWLLADNFLHNFLKRARYDCTKIMDSSQKNLVSAETQELGHIAMRGSMMNSAQWLINKTLTAGAMLLIAYFLTPSEYGVGSQALAVYGFVSILQPY